MEEPGRIGPSGGENPSTAAVDGPWTFLRQHGLDSALAGSHAASAWLIAWYMQTPPADRMIWGGLTACACLGLVVLLDRMVRLRLA